MEAPKTPATFRDDSTNLSSSKSPKHASLALMDFTTQFLRNAIVLSLLLSGVLLIVVSPYLSNPFSSLRRNACGDSKLSATNFTRDELESTLERASAGNKTVIIVIVNKAYAEQSVNAETTMLDLFLESFWLGEGTRKLLDHLMLVAVDQTAYERCRFKKLNCYRLQSDDREVDYGREKVYMSRDFIDMMWRRTLFLLEVLKRGYSFIFTDSDVMWLRNPFERLSQNTSIDFQISVDIRNTKLINTGFYFIRSNNKTISLFNSWYNMRHNSAGMKEQDVLSNLLKAGAFDRLNLTTRFLDTKYFSGFCHDSRNMKEVTTVHANCCRHIGAKVTDLTAVLRDWKRFKAVTRKYNQSASVYRDAVKDFRWSPHANCLRSWNDTKYGPIEK